jgi:hypothetical protein
MPPLAFKFKGLFGFLLLLNYCDFLASASSKSDFSRLLSIKDLLIAISAFKEINHMFEIKLF